MANAPQKTGNAPVSKASRGRAAAAELTPEQRAAKQAEKRKHFVELCGKRMAKALKTIDLVGNCSGPAYAYTEDDVRKIRDAFARCINGVLERFKPREKGVASAPGFSFDAPQNQV